MGAMPWSLGPWCLRLATGVVRNFGRFSSLTLTPLPRPNDPSPFERPAKVANRGLRLSGTPSPRSLSVQPEGLCHPTLFIQQIDHRLPVSADHQALERLQRLGPNSITSKSPQP
jgi:hypothetical protein